MAKLFSGGYATPLIYLNDIDGTIWMANAWEPLTWGQLPPFPDPATPLTISYLYVGHPWGIDFYVHCSDGTMWYFDPWEYIWVNDTLLLANLPGPLPTEGPGS